MARWDPGTEERLTRAALDLYTEHGYDRVTVTQIAERAGITRRSYFRYFPDKREVLFAGSEQLPAALHQAVLAADSGPPLSTALAALADVGIQLTAHASHARERRTVINASAELRERERTKLAAVTTSIREALAQRGTEAGRAGLVAQVAALVFRNAFDQWLDADGRTDFAACLHAAFASLQSTVDEGAAGLG